MTSYDKVVKLACKPKAAPPKAKYLDPIIAATWSDDGAVHDVCKALSPRFREPNAIVVFKALIVLHTMIRNGGTDNVLSHLSSSQVLRLHNVSNGSWDGYSAPENLQNYAAYLDSRIRAYHDLKHDAIRVQAESNRDMRNANSIEEDGYRPRNGTGSSTKASTSGPTRSKTIMGRKLRVMTVEKGLLRETKAVHRMIDALVECRFYLDDLEDELTTTALRMLVKDLLILFQAGNEGVINVLEHYFEMSHPDAEEALGIYRHFCKQTERVVEYLGVAKKLQNLLNVPVPNLKHAPVSLAGALQEYLEDPNFEQNRIEYKTNKEAVERAVRNGTSLSKRNDKSTAAAKSEPPPLPSNPTPSSGSGSRTTDISGSNAKPMVDFFAAIEEEQSTMFNPQTQSPNTAYFQQQGASNPFIQRQLATGNAFIQQPQVYGQPTGYAAPQQVAFQPSTNPFGALSQQGQPTGHPPFSSFPQPQATGFLPSQPQLRQQQPQPTGLQPQPTGSNPFRQSMMFPQTTGMAMFGVGGPGGQIFSSISQNSNLTAQGGAGGHTPQNPTPATAPVISASPSFGSAFGQGSFIPSNLPARPASTPLRSFGTSSSTTSPPVAQPVKTHQTGSRNPFGPIMTPPPPVPKQPTLMELASGVNGNSAMYAQQHSQQTGTPAASGGFGFNSSALGAGPTDISSIASSFALPKTSGSANESNFSGTYSSSSGPLNSQNTSTTTSGSTFSDSLFSSFSTQPTGATAFSSSPSIASSTLKPQMTGFSGLKPFKPSSSFGASLLESLPPIPGSSPTTPAATGSSVSSPTSGGMFSPQSGNMVNFGAQPTGFGASNQTGGFSASGSSLGQGLRPQMTGGATNPFRASTMGLPAGGVPNMPGGTSLSATSPQSPSFFGGSGVPNSASPASFLGTNFHPSAGTAFSFAGAQVNQPQNGPSSLI